MDGEDNYSFKATRNIFVQIEKSPLVKSMLKKTDTSHVELDGHLYALGEPALQLAQAFNKGINRPMSRGVINPKEAHALPIIDALIGEVLGVPEVPGEIVFYSVPADPVDQDFNAIYHRNVFDKILRQRGYTPTPLNEGLAVIYSELLDENLSGFGISCGAGMINVCCAVLGQEIFSFSVAMSGDYIDTNVATALAISEVKALRAKEAIVDLTKPQGNIEEAVQYYYKHMLGYVVDNIIQKLKSIPQLPEFSTPPTVAVAGGTAMPQGFVELLTVALNHEDMPIQIGEVIKADNPLKAIAKGCLYAAVATED
jgi:hypothetical protein